MNVNNLFSSQDFSFKQSSSLPYEYLDSLPEDKLAIELCRLDLFDKNNLQQLEEAIPLFKKLSKTNLISVLTKKPFLSIERPLSKPEVFSAALPLFQTLVGEPELFFVLSYCRPEEDWFFGTLYNSSIFEAALPFLEELPESQIVELLKKGFLEPLSFFSFHGSDGVERALPLFKKLSFESLMKVAFPAILDPDIFKILSPLLENFEGKWIIERMVEHSLDSERLLHLDYKTLRRIFIPLLPSLIEAAHTIKSFSDMLLSMLTHLAQGEGRHRSLLCDPEIFAAVTPLFKTCSKEDALKIIQATALEERPLFKLALPYLEKINYVEFYNAFRKWDIPSVFIQEKSSKGWSTQDFLDFFYLFDKFSTDHKYVVLLLRFPSPHPLENEAVFKQLLPTLKTFSSGQLTKILSRVATFALKKNSPLHNPKNLALSIPLLKKLTPNQLTYIFSSRDDDGYAILSSATRKNFIDKLEKEGFSETQVSAVWKAPYRVYSAESIVPIANISADRPALQK